MLVPVDQKTTRELQRTSRTSCTSSSVLDSRVICDLGDCYEATNHTCSCKAQNLPKQTPHVVYLHCLECTVWHLNQHLGPTMSPVLPVRSSLSEISDEINPISKPTPLRGISRPDRDHLCDTSEKSQQLRGSRVLFCCVAIDATYVCNKLP